jgi:hypothetical protein
MIVVPKDRRHVLQQLAYLVATVPINYITERLVFGCPDGHPAATPFPLGAGDNAEDG